MMLKDGFVVIHNSDAKDEAGDDMLGYTASRPE